MLVVEDDAPTREMLRRTLEKEGWQVRGGGERPRGAWRSWHEAVPALILLDLMMPEMDGFEFMEELRQRPDCRAGAGDCHHGQGPDRGGPAAAERPGGAHHAERARCAWQDLVREVRALIDVAGLGFRSDKQLRPEDKYGKNPLGRRQRNEPRHALAPAGTQGLRGGHCAWTASRRSSWPPAKSRT